MLHQGRRLQVMGFLFFFHSKYSHPVICVPLLERRAALPLPWRQGWRGSSSSLLILLLWILAPPATGNRVRPYSLSGISNSNVLASVSVFHGSRHNWTLLVNLSHEALNLIATQIDAWCKTELHSIANQFLDLMKADGVFLWPTVLYYKSNILIEEQAIPPVKHLG